MDFIRPKILVFASPMEGASRGQGALSQRKFRLQGPAEDRALEPATFGLYRESSNQLIFMGKKLEE
ncbi:MAG: hypothetical protein ACLFSY_02965 [Desulfonatronovibrionaceae bacterium]